MRNFGLETIRKRAVVLGMEIGKRRLRGAVEMGLEIAKSNEGCRGGAWKL